MSYIIIKNELVATTSETLASGEEVRMSWLTDVCGVLFNTVYAKVSNAKKWAGVDAEHADRAVLHSDNGMYKTLFASKADDDSDADHCYLYRLEN